MHPFILACIWVAFLMGSFLCVMNFSLPLRYYLRVWRKQPQGPNVSAVPILGSLFVYLTLDALVSTIPAEVPGATIALKAVGYTLIAIDVGGIHWVIISMFIQLFREIRKRL